MKILVVEPIYEHAHALRSHFLSLGHPTVTTKFHDEALDIFRSWQPQLGIVSCFSLYGGPICAPDLALRVLAMPIPRPTLVGVVNKLSRPQRAVLEEFGYEFIHEKPIFKWTPEAWMVRAAEVRV